MYDYNQQHDTTSGLDAVDRAERRVESRAIDDAVPGPSVSAEERSEPPYTNRGVRIEGHGGFRSKNPKKTGKYAECAFDWYQASIPAQPELIQGRFIERFKGEFEPCAPINGYEHGVKHSALKFSIYWGGHNPYPNIKATSHHAQRIAVWVREVFPSHKVSRVDVCFDFSFPGAFDYLTSMFDPRARKVRAASSFVGDLAENDPDFDRPDENGKCRERKGRTWYFGSTRSDQMVTIYEKGLELRSKGIPDVDLDLVRVEVRVRPQKLRKQQAAQLGAFEIVGFSKWISQAMGDILDEAPTVLPNYDKLEKPPLAALEHMAQQYAGHIRGFLEGADRGGRPRTWADLNRFLETFIYSQKERRKMESEGG